MRLVLLLVLSASLTACGDDGKKVVTSCAVDTDCEDGVCYDSACYTACPDSVATCGADEMCVLKTRDSGDVAVCAAAASVTCDPDAEDPCAEAYSRECRHAKCDPDTLQCTFAELPDNTECWSYKPTPTSEAADPDQPLAGICFHGECRSPCTEGNECDDVCALRFIQQEQLYCVSISELACRVDGFGEESSDACSSVWNHATGVCEFSTSVEGPGTPVAANCGGASPACISEGCTTTCVSDADCAGGTCQGFYSYDALPDDTAIGFFKACR